MDFLLHLEAHDEAKTQLWETHTFSKRGQVHIHIQSAHNHENFLLTAHKIRLFLESMYIAYYNANYKVLIWINYCRLLVIYLGALCK